ncbi:hypothetical protein GF342_00105 [Candidatus Woesearchaeota archaeon]|nr:hypothetical protein [Candidatus Woesearchaeota archaeon]
MKTCTYSVFPFVNPYLPTSQQLRIVNRALEKNPRHPLYLQRKAELLSKLKKKKEALAILDKARECGLEEIDVMQSKVDVYRELHDAVGEERLLRRYMRRQPNNVYWPLRVYWLFRETNSSKALSAMKKVIKLEPFKVSHYEDLAHLYYYARNDKKYKQTLKLIHRKFGLARSLLDLARRYFDNHEHKKANKFFAQAFAENFSFAEYDYVVYVDSLKAEGKFSEAEKFLTHAISLMGPDEGILTARADLFMVTDQVKKAIADYEKLAVLQPENSDVCNRLTALYFSIGKNKKAHEYAKRASEIDKLPSLYPHVLFTQGNEREKLREINKKLKQYSSIVLLETKATCLRELGRFREAAKVFLSLPPTLDNWLSALECLRKCNDWTSYYDLAKKVLMKFPRNFRALYVLLEDFDHFGKPGKAYPIADKIIKWYPKDQTGYLTGSRIARSDGKAKKALAYLERGLPYHKKDLQYEEHVINALSHVGNHDRALRVVQQARKRAPHNEFLLLWEAVLLAFVGKPKKGLSLLDKAPSWTREFDLVHAHSEILHAQGRIDEAMQLLDEFHKKKPWIAQYHRAISILYAQKGDPDKAVSHAEIFYKLTKHPDDGVELVKLLFRYDRKKDAIQVMYKMLELDKLLSKTAKKYGQFYMYPSVVDKVVRLRNWYLKSSK